MQKSIELQRASVQKQVGSSSTAGFFVLPAPTATPNQASLSSADCTRLPDSEVSALVDQAAQRQDLDRNLLRTVMRQESGFRPCAVSAKGAAGMMQLMPATAAQLGVKNVWNPSENVDGGARLLKQMLTRYNGDTEKALAAYNAGPGAVDAADGVPQYSETLDYVRQIVSFLNLTPTP
jgi:soluble lytic murein transglycosylase-like protein